MMPRLILKWLSFLWLAVVLLAGGYLSARIYQGLNFRTDLMALLPQEQQEPALQAANDAVTKALSRKVLILVGDKNRDSARAAAMAITQRLTDSGLFEKADSNLDKEHLQRIGTFYFPYRYGLLADEDRETLKNFKAIDLANRALSQAYGVFGIANGRLLANDPFMLLPGFLTSLPVPMSHLTLDDGLLSLQDDGTTWVLVAAQIKGEAFALDIQKQIAALYNQATGEQRAAYPGLQILHLGAVFFAQAGAKQAMGETSIIGIASTVGTILLVLLAFRAMRPLLLSLLVIGVGVMMALAVSLLIYGELHVGALLFGVSLIGVAVDYSLQYCSEVFAVPSEAPQQKLARVRAGITIGAATTIIGYLTLYLAPFPGLHQIAAFSVVGLFSAWVTVILWLPLLDHQQAARRAPQMLAAAENFLNFWENKKYRWARAGFLIAAAMLGIVGLSQFYSDDDVHHMQSLSAPLVAEQQQLQKIIGMTGSAQFFLVQAPDDETALQREEKLVDRLRPLMETNALAGFQSVAQFIPSMARQKENRILQRERLYKNLLMRQETMLNLAGMPQMPDDNAPYLKLQDIRKIDNPFSFLSSLVQDNADGAVTHVVMLDGVTQPEIVAAAAKGIEGVRFMNPTDDFSHLLTKYRVRAMGLLALSALLMLPLLVWRYGVAKGLWVMLPPALAVVLAPALRALMGGAFTFFDAMGLVLVLSIGVDYAVFCAETSGTRRAVTMLAVALAACTALMSFGLLALSGVQAVHNFGATMTLGILLSFLFAPLACLSSRAHKKLSLRNLLPLALLVMLCSCAETEQPVTQQVTIAPNLTLTMPSPDSLGRQLEATQLVTVRHEGQTFAFEAHISATPERFLLVGLDMVGRRMISVTWTKAGIVYDRASWVPDQVQPEHILADIVLLYWPENVVRQSLSLLAKIVSNEKTRGISMKGQKLWQADYHPIDRDIWDGKLHYRNLAWDYEFDVQSSEVAP